MSNKHIVKNFYRALTKSDSTCNINEALSYLDKDVLWRVAHPINDLKGHEEFLAYYWKPIKTALPDIEYKPFIMLEGDYQDQQWVNSTGYLIGTFEKPLFDIPPTGKVLYLRYGELMHVVDGKIVECYIIPDFIDAMNQAGVNPTRPCLGCSGLVMPPSTMDGLSIGNKNGEESAKSLKLVLDMLDGLMRYDGQSLLSMDQEKFWHTDFMWYGPGGIGTTRGLDGFRKHHQGPFLSAFPDRSVDTSISFIAEDNYVATGGWPHMSATHTGDGWIGLPASGKKISIRVMDFWRREGELLTENWVSIDMIHLLLQMGHDVFHQMREKLSHTGKITSATDKNIQQPANVKSGKQSMSGFDEEFTDIADYILRITDRIWKEKNIGSISRYYAPDSVIHTLGGPVHGSEAVINGTIQTLAAFPDRRLHAENVIWSGNDKEGFYTSHRIISPDMTNLGHSEFGPPTGKQATVRTIVDCFIKDNQIHEEWLMRDNMGLVKQLGFDPHAVAQQLADANRDNTLLHSWLASEIDRLRSMNIDTNTHLPSRPRDALNEFIENVFSKIWHQQDLSTIETVYAPDCQLHGPANRELQGHKELNSYVVEILNTLSNIRKSIDHICSIPYQDDDLDVNIRWTLTGLHDKEGIYGAPSHKDLLILGCTHWRLVNDKIAEEWTVFDELAVLRQIYTNNI